MCFACIVRGELGMAFRKGLILYVMIRKQPSASGVGNMYDEREGIFVLSRSCSQPTSWMANSLRRRVPRRLIERKQAAEEPNHLFLRHARSGSPSDLEVFLSRRMYATPGHWIQG